MCSIQSMEDRANSILGNYELRNHPLINPLAFRIWCEDHFEPDQAWMASCLNPSVENSIKIIGV